MVGRKGRTRVGAAWHRRLIVPIVLIVLVVSLGALIAVDQTVASAEPVAGPEPTSTLAPTSTLPEPGRGVPGNIIPEPNSGIAPEDPGDRGGWQQWVVLGVIVAGVGVIVGLVVRESRRKRAPPRE